MKYVVHAPNIHCGGGLVLLGGLLQALPRGVYANLDERMPVAAEALKRLEVRRVKPTIWHRLKAEFFLVRMAKQGDIVLCFGNLPPVFHVDATVKLFLHNRYLIDRVSLADFPLKVRLRVMAERAWFRLFRSRVDRVIVQSPSMKELLETRFAMESIVLPFVVWTGEDSRHGDADSEGKVYDFSYVASGEPHKNHINLIKAWVRLAAKGIRPSLCLTLNKEHFPELVAWIEAEKNAHGLNIQNLGTIPREDIRNLYMKTKALIFPSTLESFGLPLLEAKEAGLSIVASEIDVVRDVVDPVESFDPHSPLSISRAVMRFLGEKRDSFQVLDAATFLDHLNADDDKS